MNNIELKFYADLELLLLKSLGSKKKVKSENVINLLYLILEKDNEGLEIILNRMNYSLKDIIDFDCFKTQERFTVWVGGSEVNDVYLLLKSAYKTAYFWRESEGYDDVQISIYEEKES